MSAKRTKPMRLLRAGTAALLALASHDATADCFKQAAAYHRVNPLILRAIAWQESRGRPEAVNVNRNGSTDYGMMQINSIHLRELAQYGVSQKQLMDSCTSVYVAAWHLRKKMNKYGNNWDAVGAYHSETKTERDKYASAIKAIVAQAPNPASGAARNP